MKKEFSNAKSADTRNYAKLLLAVILSVVLFGGAMFLLFANHTAPVQSALAETSSTLPTTLTETPVFTYDSSAGTITGTDKTINGYNFKDDVYTAEVGSVTLGQSAVTLKQYTSTTPTQVVIPSQIKIGENTYQVVIDCSNNSYSSFFANKSNVTSISFASIGEAKVLATNCQYMFYYCSSLTSLDLSSFDTSNVTTMHDMFSGCSSLTSAGVNTAEKTYALNFGPNFNTSNVTDMGRMFDNCSSLTSLDLRNFNTSNVTDMSGMFSCCSSLTSLDLSNFNTSKVTNMIYMFSDCSGLTSLVLRNFDTSKVTDMSSMFYNCSKLTSLNLSSFNTGKVTNMGIMFVNCSSLTSLDLSNFDTGNVGEMWGMFYGCSSLTNLNINSFNTSKVIRFSTFYNGLNDWAGMFKNCSSLTSLDLSSFDLTSASLCDYMFSNCTNLKMLKTPAVMAGKTLAALGLSAGTYFVSTDAMQTKLASDATVPEGAILVTDAQYIPVEPTEPTSTGVATSLLFAVSGAVVIALFAVVVAHVGKKKRVVRK